MEYDGSSSSKDAVDVLTVTFLEQNNADIWEITDGEVIVNKNVASHNLIFSNIIADGKEINGQFTVSIQ